MILQKVEIRFEKSEAVRFISHHDLMRAMMRAVRRAGLPVRLTEGYNPRSRIVFPVALEVGIASLDEVAEIEFNQWLDTQDVFRRLDSAFPPGLKLKAVTEMPLLRAGRIPQRVIYRIHVQEAGLEIPPERLTQLLAETTLPFQRPREKRMQSVDLRPVLSGLKLEMGELEVEVRPSQKGTARPLEVLSLLTDRTLENLKHVRVTKTRMDLVSPKDIQQPPSPTP